LAAASRQRLAVVLLGALVWLLPLLLGLEPAVALDRVAAGSVAARLVGPSLSPALPSVAPRLVGEMGPAVLSSDRLAPPSDSAASVPELFQQALEASRGGRFDRALPLWNLVLERAPGDAAAWSNRGNVQLALGDPLAAIADQDHSLLLEPDNADPHLNRGTAEESLGQWDAAEADYRWILERDPTDASALYNLGNVQGSRGDWLAARTSFTAAADARPSFAMARSSAALAAFQLGDLVEAERQLRNLIRRYPLFADARAGLTSLLWQRGAAGEAESHWAAASGLDPRYRQSEWLSQIRRWPPEPVHALESFLALASR
jgi:tetratricopeptide (TPR) repeat protein